MAEKDKNMSTPFKMKGLSPLKGKRPKKAKRLGTGKEERSKQIQEIYKKNIKKS